MSPEITGARWRSEIAEAVARMGALAHFPADASARATVMELLAGMIPFGRSEQLRWLVTTLINRVGEWHGTAELRGVYCTRFQPADGIEAICRVTPGFRGPDLEWAAAAPKELSPAEKGRVMKLIEGVAHES